MLKISKHKISYFDRIASALLSILMVSSVFVFTDIADVRTDAASKSEIQSKMISILYGNSGGRMTCDFDGYVNTNGRHEGIDFAKGSGSEVHALISGKVLRAYNTTSSSQLSTLSIYDESNNKSVIYLHTANMRVKSGDYVNRGDVIAYEGDRGAGSSPHTHVEVRNGQNQYAATSVNDYTLENENPYPYWEKVLFNNPTPDLIVDTSYPTPFQSYPANGSGKTTVYDRGLSAYSLDKRYISPGDLCVINEVYTNGYCKVTYPTGSGDKTEFAKTSDFIPNAVQKYTYSPSQNLTSYTRSDLAVKFGSVFTTDKCTVVGKSGNRIQLIYPGTGGNKLGWVDPPVDSGPSDFKTPLYAYNASSTDMTMVYQYLSTLGGEVYGKIFVDDKCTLNTVNVSDGWIYVTYPTSKGDKSGYVYLDQFIPSDSKLNTFYQAKVSQQTDTFRKRDMSVNYGYVSVGDTITVVGKSGDKLQICYPLDSGGWKLAWIYNHNVIKDLKEIYVAANPSKTTYLEGESFNSSGLAINARYTDGSTANVTGSCSLSGYSSSPGTKTITASYSGKSTAFTVVVNKKSLTGISIISNPSKTSYYENENINLSGLQVRASFNNNTTANLGTSDYYVDTNNITSSVGNKNVTVFYEFNGVSKSASFGVSVSHNIGDWTITKNATCTETGTKVKKCKVCGYVSETQTIAAIGHSYTTQVVAPTCTAQGYTNHTCSKCGHNYKDTYTNVTSHNYGAWTVTKNATCTEKGSQTRKCQTCGHTETTEIAATGHSYTTKVVAPTCTAQGYTLHTCSKCGNNYKDTYTNATGHNFGAWTVTKNATCTEKGSKTRKCQNCSHTETADIAATGHKYTEKVISPTETENGYTLHTCSVCGDSYQSDITDPLGPPDPNAPSIVVGQKSAIQGQTVTVDISMKNNPGIVGFKIDISYDKDVLTLQNAETIGFDAMYSESMTAMPFTVSWESGFQDVTLNGEIIRLTFAVNEKAADGSYPVTVSYQPDDIYNLKEENIHFAVINGSVEVKQHIAGDINNDGKVNMKDVTRLHQYINGWNVAVVESAVDVNGDGKVNMKDLTRLHQYINGWSVAVY